MTGTAIQAAVSLTPPSHHFGAVTARSNSPAFTFVLKNSGTAALTIRSITIGGATRIASHGRPRVQPLSPSARVATLT